MGSHSLHNKTQCKFKLAVSNNSQQDQCDTVWNTTRRNIHCGDHPLYTSFLWKSTSHYIKSILNSYNSMQSYFMLMLMHTGIPNMYFITPSSFQRLDTITSNNPNIIRQNNYWGFILRHAFISSMQMQHKITVLCWIFIHLRLPTYWCVHACVHIYMVQLPVLFWQLQLFLRWL